MEVALVHLVEASATLIEVIPLFFFLWFAGKVFGFFFPNE